jgi:hypothetical protein
MSSAVWVAAAVAVPVPSAAHCTLASLQADTGLRWLCSGRLVWLKCVQKLCAAQLLHVTMLLMLCADGLHFQETLPACVLRK